MCAAVDCTLLHVFFLLIDFWVFVCCNLFYFFPAHNLFHHFFFARSGKDVREHSELCLVYMSLIGENVTSWSIKCAGFLFPQYDNCCFWKWPRGGCSVAVDDARSRKRTRYQNNTFKTGGGINKQHKGAKSGMFVLLCPVLILSLIVFMKPESCRFKN